MTPAIIISRYADPDINNRRRNVREGIALARWAAAQGYAPIGWWDDIDVNDPPCDSDPAVRQAALERSATRARMVGKAGGCVIVPGWYHTTDGMERDLQTYWDNLSNPAKKNMELLTFAEIEPYLPRDLVGQVQSAVDEMRDKSDNAFLGSPQEIAAVGIRGSIGCIAHHTGIRPTEVTKPTWDDGPNNYDMRPKQEHLIPTWPPSEVTP